MSSATFRRALAIIGCILATTSFAAPVDPFSDLSAQPNAFPEPLYSTCSNDQRRKIKVALLQMDSYMNRAGVALTSPTFTLMNSNSDVRETYDEAMRGVTERRPLTYLQPARKPVFNCVTEQNPHPRELGPPERQACLGKESPLIVMPADGKLFICPLFYEYPVVPPADPCPKVVDNKFKEPGFFEQGQNMIVMWGMLPMYFPGVEYSEEYVQYKSLNEAIADRDDPTSANVIGFLELGTNQCRSIPDITKPPWTGRTTVQTNLERPSLTLDGVANQPPANGSIILSIPKVRKVDQTAQNLGADIAVS